MKQEIVIKWDLDGPDAVFTDGMRRLQPSPYSAKPADQPARVYVASTLTNIVAAAVLASQLRDRRVDVVSTWHDQRATVEAENAMAPDDKARLAMKCFAEIDRADVFVWLHGMAGERCGAAVEYGYALKAAKIIYLVGIGGDAAPSVFGALGPEITATALLRRLGGA